MKSLRIVAAIVFLLGNGSWASAQALDAAPVAVTTEAQAAPVVESNLERPRALMPLYAMQIALNGLDVHSTMRALDAGHREVNPLFKDGSAAKLIGAKVASSALSFYLAEKLWKKNRVAAVVMMASVNAGMMAVVANNYRVANTPRR